MLSSSDGIDHSPQRWMVSNRQKLKQNSSYYIYTTVVLPPVHTMTRNMLRTIAECLQKQGIPQ